MTVEPAIYIHNKVKAVIPILYSDDGVEIVSKANHPNDPIKQCRSVYTGNYYKAGWDQIHGAEPIKEITKAEYEAALAR